VEVTVKREGATRTGLVPRFWAEQKVADLSADVTANASALEEVGKSFNLVTPNTSLLVLETAEQYVEHGIVPPANRKDVYEKFAQLIEQRRVREQQTREQRLNEVLALWDARVKWWEKSYEYPKDFAYHGGVEGRGRGDTAALVATPAQEAANGGVAPLQERLGTADVRRFAEARPAPAAGEPALTVAAKRSLKDGRESSDGVAIQVKPWDPDVPYLKAMREAGPDGAYAAYLKNRPGYVSSPAFYLDCAEYLLAHDQKALGLRVLTNIAELKLESAPLLRIVAHRLQQAGERDLAIDLFERIKAMRPKEPQSWRDLALALDDRARWRIAGVSHPSESAPALEKAYAAARADFQRAIELLEHVVMTKWDRFPEIELPTLMEANALIERANRLLPGEHLNVPLDSRLVKNLDCDVRIVLTWDADLTDVDLWVTEPSGEKCVYDHNRTTIGGLLSHDFTQGYGPEEYCLRKMMPGAYKVQAHYYGSTQTSLVGPVTIQATVITHFGQPDERRQALTVRLDKPKDVVDLGTITLEK
jgi:tetratricopeptide (TPR) repeat protein